MKQRITKFLEFKGKNLLFVTKEGIYWIAIKPVCEVLGVDYIRQFKNISDDPILGPALSKQTMQVPGDQSRNMVCLPEHLIYGWIFSVKSESPELLEYKKECYNILFDYFHGIITGRRELIRGGAIIKHERIVLEEQLRKSDIFVKYENIKAQEARIDIHLKRIDSEELNIQFDLFDED